MKKPQKIKIVERYCSCGSLLVGHGNTKCLKCYLAEIVLSEKKVV